MVVWLLVVASLPWLKDQWIGVRAVTVTPPSSQQELIVLPAAGVKPVIDFLQAAQTSLDVNVYLLTEPKILQTLAEAKARGVNVRVIFEHQPFGGGFFTGKISKQLAAANIPVRDGPRRFTYDHAKYVVRDSSTALISTANFTTAAFTKDRDFIIIDREPSDVELLHNLFAADWDNAPFYEEDPEVVISPNNATTKLNGLLRAAKQDIIGAVEVFDDPGIKESLLAAVKRGVAVKFLLADPKTIRSNQTAYDDLVAGGVRVNFQKKPILHAKYLVVDGRVAYLGSVNFTTNSLLANREVGLLTVTPAVLRSLRDWFELDWDASPDKVSFSCWRLCGILYPASV